MKIATTSIFIALFLSVTYIGCNLFTRTPSQTVSKFYELSKQGKPEDAEKLLTKYVASAKERGSRSYAQIISDAAKSRPISSVKIENETVNGNQATVSATVTRADGTAIFNHNLIKEDGEWRIETIRP